MKKQKILLSVTCLLLCFMLLFTGCSSPTGENEKGGTTASLSTNEPQNKDLQKAVLLLAEVLSPMPDVLSFFPESFSKESMVPSSAPIDFGNDFVQLSSVTNEGFGKQLNVIYTILSYVQECADIADLVYKYSGLIVEAYQLFINENPDNYASFEKQTENFDFKITLTEDSTELLVAFATASVELRHQKSSGISYGRIQLSDQNVLKYEFSDEMIRFAMNVSNVALWNVELNRNSNGTISGKLTEFYGINDNYIKTVAMIEITEAYTYIICDKRESLDLSIEGYLEVYNNKTGKLIGGRVKETVKSIEYDTYWFYLSDFSGIQTIKKIDKENVDDSDVNMNPDDIYINGKTEHIHTKLVGGLGLKMFSRRFDIEFRESNYFVYDATAKKYTKVSGEIPMIFVQAEFVNTLVSDFEEANDVKITCKLTQEELNAITNGYDKYVGAFVEYKNKVSKQDVLNYIGQEHGFFLK